MYASVKLWDRTIGAIAQNEGEAFARFQYDPDFARSGIQVSPITMPLSDQVFSFPQLPINTFHGLPGLLADSLPDRFGNALIDAWLATQGRTADSFSAIERLCYTGSRGVGALEYEPALGPETTHADPLQISALVDLASEILTHRSTLSTTFDPSDPSNAMNAILRVGTSAGGARAKALIAWNPSTNEVRSGQIATSDGFEYWMLKFDGVSGNKDKELEDPRGYGAIEYAYYLMASAAGITMSECRLFEENGRRHFMTRRFDRTPEGGKMHMQSLGALAHFDFNLAGAYSYEQAFMVMRQLGLSMVEREEQFRRMVFNVHARNQDDHVKNIAFLMNQRGTWSLSPAFDMTYAFNPGGEWTATHQMTINGKRSDIRHSDLMAAATVATITKRRASNIIDEVLIAIRRWSEFAEHAGLSESEMAAIKMHLLV
jgi:serine/threonine-protein kinase HipA